MTADKKKVDALEAALAAVEEEAAAAASSDEPGRTADLANLASAKRALETVARDRAYRAKAS